MDLSSFKSKSAKDLSLQMLLLLILVVTMWLTYGLLVMDTAIIYTNSSYTPTTASAVDLIIGNNYIIISGSNFKSSASVFIDATTGSIVSYVNENQLNVNVATKTAGTYPIYLMNTDGASTFKINAITYIAGSSGKAIFGYGYTSAVVSMTNLVSNAGVVATDTTGVGTARSDLAAAGYSTT